MHEILNGDHRVLKIVPSFDVREDEYRMMNYCVRETVDDQTLLLNLLNRKMVLISKDEEGSNEVRRYLIENGFLVPVNFDEYNFLLGLRTILKRITSATCHDIHNFTIFTTLACNAKCYYCFENKKKKSSMSLETANQVAKFIYDNIGHKEIAYIRWFGGEPLLNKEVINVISKKLKLFNVDFCSSIITNGTLFDDQIIQETATNWNIDIVQITLDGTKEVHDKIKLVEKNTTNSAFETTIKNIHLLLRKKINVQIRLNLSEKNYDNLLDLIDFIDNEFDDKQHLSIYCKTLFEKGNEEVCFRNENDERNLRTMQYIINEKIYDLGLYKKCLSTEFKTSHCAAATGDVVTILPNGNIGLCEHKGLDEDIGNVYNGIRTFDVIKQYTEELPLRPECKNCPILPDCNRQLTCDAVTNYCIKEKQKVMIQEIKMQMKNVRNKNEIKV